MTKRVLYGLVGLLFFTLVYSCGLTGPKPDKRVVATLELVGDDLSEEEMNEAVFAIKNRFEKFGAYPEVSRVPQTNKLKFSLETAAGEDRILKFLTVKANLQFYHVISSKKMMNFMMEADQIIAGDSISEVDALIGEENDEENLEEYAPLLVKLQSSVESAGMFSVLEADTALVMGYLRRNDVLNLLGSDKRKTKFVWGLKSKRNDAFTLYPLRTLGFGKAPLDGSTIERAAPSYSPAGMPTITIQMNAEGAEIWEKMTEEAYDNASLIAIVLDNIVRTAPGINNGPIYGGRSEISGEFTIEETTDLASMISFGAIPKTKVLSFDVEPLK